MFFVIKTNQMQYLSLIYFANQRLHVLGMFIDHHQEVFTIYVQQLVCVIQLGDWLLDRSEWNWPGQQPVTINE
jgi:hypothetical protein